MTGGSGEFGATEELVATEDISEFLGELCATISEISGASGTCEIFRTLVPSVSSGVWTDGESEVDLTVDTLDGRV